MDMINRKKQKDKKNGKNCNMRAKQKKNLFQVELRNDNAKIKYNFKRECETKVSILIIDTDADLVPTLSIFGSPLPVRS